VYDALIPSYQQADLLSGGVAFTFVDETKIVKAGEAIYKKAKH
jgi:hypothetical protein